MSKKIIIASCTQGNETEFENKPLGKSLKKLQTLIDENDEIHLKEVIFFNNTKGLSACYNKVLDSNKDADYILFIHDDCLLTDMFVFEKLENAFKTFDIVGVAGSKSFDIKRRPVVWHNSDRSQWSGAVEHPIEQRTDNLIDGNFNYIMYGQTPSQCAIIDGLFIGVNNKKIGELRFIEEFDFHFYDLAFSIEAFKKQLKVGVTNIHLTHMSHGDFRNEKWAKLEQKFIERYSSK